MAHGKVLVVDDDGFVLKSVRATLEAAGYDVATYRSAITVPLELRAQRPDVVLLDVTMPDLVAEDAVKGMRRLEIMNGVPIILYSSKSEAELSALTRASGAHGFIIKGPEQDLLNGVQRWIAHSRTTRGVRTPTA
jgi:PleD family two-component response regulator